MEKAKHTNYSLSILLTLAGSFGLSIALLLLHFLDLPEISLDWVAEFVETAGIVAFVSRMVSGDGYLFQFFDKAFEEATVFDLAKNLWNAIFGKEGPASSQTEVKPNFFE